MIDMAALALSASSQRGISSMRGAMRTQSQRIGENELAAVKMRQDIEKLYLLVEALWAVLKQATGLKDDDLADLVQQIDLEDGKLDGCNAENTVARTCANCGKTLLRGQTRCAYCGEEMLDSALFRHNGK